MDADITIFQIALYKPGGAYYGTMQRWMGTDVASRGDWFGDENFQKIIGDNIKRRIAIDNNAAPRSTYIYYSCPDMTDSKCKEGKTSYVYNSIGFFWVRTSTRANYSSVDGRINCRQTISEREPVTIMS